MLRARPRLRLDRDDLRDASDQGRVSGPPRRGQRLARKAHAPRGGRTVAAGIVDHGRPERRKHTLQLGRGGARWRRDLAGARRDGDFLRRRGGRHRHHRPPRRRRRRIRSGAAGHHPGRLHAGAHARMGDARHAWHLQRRLQAELQGLRGTDIPRAIRKDPCADDDARRPSVLVVGLGGNCGRGGGPGAALHPQGRARVWRQYASRRGAFHRRQDDPDETARHHRREPRVLCRP